jgi:hypothetical protein
MSRYLDISALSDRVLESVRAETSTKTAAAHVAVRSYVPAARELRKLADDLREAGPEDEVSNPDLEALMQDPETIQLLQELAANPELLHHLLEQGAGGPEGQELAEAAGVSQEGAPDGDMPAPEMMPSGAHPDMDPEESSGLPPGAMGAPPASALPGLKAASEIRKIAAQLKIHHEQSKRVRLVKAAQMLNAAVGLKHLTEGFR